MYSRRTLVAIVLIMMGAAIAGCLITFDADRSKEAFRGSVVPLERGFNAPLHSDLSPSADGLASSRLLVVPEATPGDERAALISVRCIAVNHHDNSPLAGLLIGLKSGDGSHVASACTDESGEVMLRVPREGMFRPCVLSYGWVALWGAEASIVSSANKSHAPTVQRVMVVPLYATAVVINGAQPFDARFTWDSEMRIIGHGSLDAMGLAKNREDSCRLHRTQVQVYALSEPPTNQGSVALFFESQGVVTATVSLSKLIALSPLTLDTNGLPSSSGAAGRVLVEVVDPLGKVFQTGPFRLERMEALYGYANCNVIRSGAGQPIPPGEYAISAMGTPLPWLLRCASDGGSQVKIGSGESVVVRMRYACPVRDVEVSWKSDAKPLMFGVTDESAKDIRWGSAILPGHEKSIKVVLPVGRVSWRSLFPRGGHHDGGVLDVPVGEGVYHATIGA